MGDFFLLGVLITARGVYDCYLGKKDRKKKFSRCLDIKWYFLSKKD